VLTAVVTQSGAVATVQLIQTAPPNSTEDTTSAQPTAEPTAATETTVEVKEGPSPIAPELKEIAWGGGAFIVFLVAMRLWLFPRLRQGMDERYGMIRREHETADATRAAAQTEVADYQAQLAAVKAGAAVIIDDARQQLEAQRNARLAEVNAQIAEKRAAANAETEAARAAVQDQVAGAVADVAARAIQLATGKAPDPAVVDRVVADIIGAGVSR
jgi:F-type H+-transporting ATPase subunit b